MITRTADVEASIQTCPNCLNSDSRLVFERPEGRRVRRCDDCGLEFAEVYPELSVADVNIYSRDYFASAIERANERKPIFRELIGQLNNYLGRPGRLLDVGAGEGALLETAVELGWEAVGTDISSAMVEYVRNSFGLDIRYGELEVIGLEPQSFDAIVLNHVLEHVCNPRSTLECVRDLLKNRGVVRVEVPNLASLSSRLKNLQSRLGLKSDPWKHYATDHHFWYFTPNTLRTTMERAGLEIISLISPAEQWGSKSVVKKITNRLFNNRLWGGHIVAFAIRSH